MADTDLKLKRSRAAEFDELDTESKRQKSYGHILSLLEADNEDQPIPDLASLVMTLQEEISNGSSFSAAASASDGDGSASNSRTSSPVRSREDVDDDAADDEGSVLMRHLLEASDDELGIPTVEEPVSGDFGVTVGVDINGGDEFPLCGGLWEFEDEAANYYTLLQSELFM